MSGGIQWNHQEFQLSGTKVAGLRELEGGDATDQFSS
jgi:hypothetical protein